MVNLSSDFVKYAFGVSRIGVGVNKKKECKAEVWVKDEGKGIHLGSLQWIFNKFYQARNQSIIKPKGTGLGLSISERIVAMDGGEI